MDNYMERALEIQKKVGFMDAHYDLGMVTFLYKMSGVESPLKEIILPLWKKQNLRVVVAAIFVDSVFLPEMGLRHTLQQIELVHEEIDKTEGEVVLVRNAGELKKSQEEGKIAVIMSLEGLDAMGEDPTLLPLMKRLGVSAAGLTWSRQNAVANGSRFDGPNVEHGLTTYGYTAIEIMAQLGWILDLSHLNDGGNDDVLKLYKGRLYASHSNARELCNITRNLPDRHIKGIGERKGVIGVNGCELIAGAEGEAALKKLCDHIDYMANLIGRDRIGFGFDRCDELDHMAIRLGNHPDERYDIIRDYSEVAVIGADLLKRGYTEEEVAGIFFNNMYNFFCETMEQ